MSKELFMNIKSILSWGAIGTASVFAIGARLYKLGYTPETAAQTAFANGLLTSTLQSAHRALSEPSTTSFLSTFTTAGVGVLNAYLSSTAPAPAAAPVHAAPIFAAPAVVARAPLVVPALNSFQNRLLRCHYNPDNLPEEFLCPISFEIMENPVLAKTRYTDNDVVHETAHVYDKSTYDKLNGTCPENRQKFMSCEPHVELKAKIEGFVKEQETAFALRGENNHQLARRVVLAA